MFDLVPMERTVLTNGRAEKTFTRWELLFLQLPRGLRMEQDLFQQALIGMRFSYVNTQVVEGQIGSASVSVVLTNSSAVQVSGIPLGATSQGVNQRFLYRATAASGPFRKVATLADNTTTSVVDTLANGAEGIQPVLDGTAPTPFTTIESTRDRLFFDDASNRSLLRWTEYTNPYVSVAEDFEPVNNGDGESILAITFQDNLVLCF